MKSFLLIFMLLFWTSCNEPDDNKDTPPEGPVVTQPLPTPSPEPAPYPAPQPGPGGEPPIPEPAPTEPAPTPAPVPPSSEVPPDRADTLEFNIKFTGTSSYDTAARKTKYSSALPRCKRIVSSKKFHDLILNHKFTTTTRSPVYIYDNIVDGNEKLQPTKDNEIDVGIKFYYSSGNVIGWTNGGITYINVNVKYFDKYTSDNICANLMHEYMHKLGYDHKSATDYNSAPYFIGTAVKEAGKVVK